MRSFGFSEKLLTTLLAIDKLGYEIVEIVKNQECKCSQFIGTFTFDPEKAVDIKSWMKGKGFKFEIKKASTVHKLEEDKELLRTKKVAAEMLELIQSS